MEIQKNTSLAPLTTFNIGGEVTEYISVATKEELKEALEYAHKAGVPFFILAGGSNVLIADSGFQGLCIHLQLRENEIEESEMKATAECGVNLMDFIHATCVKGLTGMESMYGIPGSVGGAVRGNAGAFGTEVKDVLQTATALHSKTLEVREFSVKECQFSYRNSFFKENKDWIITSATFKLASAEPKDCLERAEATLALRNERQIQDIQSAGSFFMNPEASKEVQKLFEEDKGVAARENRVPAGWLIDKSGYKGVCEGAACTGERSSNYVINTGSATADEVRTLTRKMHKAVQEKFGIELHEEVTIVESV